MLMLVNIPYQCIITWAISLLQTGLSFIKGDCTVSWDPVNVILSQELSY